MTANLTFHRPNQRFGLLSIYGMLALLGLLVARFIPIAKLLQPFWGCPLRRTTGVPCMACGLTRAFDWEAHGHFARAFALTPLGALAPIFCATVAVWGLAVIAVRAPVPDLSLDATAGRFVRWSVVVLVVSNWIYMVLAPDPGVNVLDGAWVLGAYLLGAVPFGLVIGRVVAGVDVRAAGSGNIGATNVARTVGKKLGLLVLVLDALKALLPVLAVRALDPTRPELHALVGGAAVLGHVFPIYLKFQGGKGVASALGALLGMAPLAALGGVALFAVVFALSRMVSLGSLLGAVLTVILAFGLGYPQPVAICALAVTTLIIVRHRGNISRMIARRENTL